MENENTYDLDLDFELVPPVVEETIEVQEDAPEVELQETQEEEIVPEETIDTDPIATSVYETLVEKGYIQADENFNGTFEWLDSQLENLPAKFLNEAIQELPDDSKAVFQFIAAAGDNITKEELIKFVKTWEEESAILVETEDEAIEYLRGKYKTLGWRDKVITTQLEDLEDNQELMTEVQKYLDEDKKQTQKLIEQKTLQNQEAEKNRQQFYNSVHDEIKNLNYAPRKVEAIKQVIPRSQQIFTEIAKSPKAYTQLMDLLTMFNGKEFDLEPIRKQGQSKATTALGDAIKKNSVSSAGTKTKSTEASSFNSKQFEVVVD